jgi:putative NIF3 family GTP cyclohydrolase 1 type 2
MELQQLYKRAISVGIAHDQRGKREINRILKEEKERYEGLKKDQKKDYDRDRLFNPFSDTRILHGAPETEVRKVIVGIDMEVGEILVAHQLNRDLDKKIDLVIGHHPEGYALAGLFDVMRLQSDLLTRYGVNLSVAEKIMETRISEVERRLLPANHNRSVDAARALGIPMLCIHTPADNCVTMFLKRLFEKEKPYRLKNLIKLLSDIPEYRKSARMQAPPKIVNGSEASRCGKIYVDMTGGTEGSKDVFANLAASGISTVVGMHISESHLESAKKSNLNVVIAGHVSSDVLGLNLLFDEIEKEGRLDFIGISGFERTRRKPRSA